MLKRCLQFFVGAVTISAASSSFGSLYYDLDQINQVVKAGDASTTVSGVFNISSAAGDDGNNQVGYNPATETITDAVAIFSLYDDVRSDSKNETETVTIDLGSEQFYNATGTYGFGFFGLVGNFISGNMLVDLAADGSLTYTIEANQGDFGVAWAKVIAHTRPGGTGTPGGNRVPDGGATLALLGGAILGLACFRRRS